MEQKKIEPIRDARKLGKAKMLILGIQHMFAMFGATILVTRERMYFRQKTLKIFICYIMQLKTV